MNASLIGADLSGHGVVSLGMVDGLSVSRRRLWQSARQRRVRRVIAQPGAPGNQENLGYLGSSQKMENRAR